jgi:hypothetical protein
MLTFINTVNNPLEQFEIKEFVYFGGPLSGARLSFSMLTLINTVNNPLEQFGIFYANFILLLTIR